MAKENTNRLAKETSPYLLEHAHDPVDWYSWSDEAFEKAKKENKPIFLSIGYSSCHWCHVMQNESFKDQEVASAMNSTFVCIKVDREERPDIDSIYMKLSQMMIGGGGWPLNVVMTYDKKPIFIATYMPKRSIHGSLGVIELASRVREIWKSGQLEEIMKNNAELFEQLKGLGAASATGAVGASEVDMAFSQIVSAYDEHYGGFGTNVKFPMASYLDFLKNYYYFRNKKTPLNIVEKTLDKMRNGGIYDQIGFGFFRYSTDRRWMVPHFEKMLYDQALMAMVYAGAYSTTGKDSHLNVAKEIIDFSLREMRNPQGAFYTALDADSEGVEGKFYLWSANEIKRELSADEAELAMKIFGISGEGNYVEHSGEQTGINVPTMNMNIERLSEELEPDTDLKGVIEKLRLKLFAIREMRKRPRIDDKILADMNGLMIAALSKVHVATGDSKYSSEAQKAADFIIKNMQKSGKLYHSFKNGVLGQSGFLDDYAFFIYGLIQLYEATFEDKYLDKAVELCDKMIEQFWDNSGGFYFTSAKAEVILVREKNTYDSSVPAGNSIALVDLLLLSRLTGNIEYEKRANKLIGALSSEINASPISHPYALYGVMLTLMKSYDVVLVGEPKSSAVKSMLTLIRKASPNVIVLIKTTKIGEIAEYTQSMESIDGKATAYICTNRVCGLPTTNVNEVLKMLEENG